MRLRHRPLAASLGALLFVGPAVAEDPEPLHKEDFATGRSIASEAEAPLQTLLVDLLVYRGSVGPGLADLRVFNAQGEEVPHAIRTLATPERVEPESVSVPMFRLPPARGDATGATPRSLARSHGVEVEIGPDGAIVRVEPAAPATSADASDPGALLLDLSHAPRDVVALQLEVGPEPAEYVVPLRVEGSDDLVSFSPKRTRSVLARLDQGGHRIERSDVSFPPTDARYLLLSADGAALPLEVRAVRARLAPTVSLPPRRQTRLVAAPVADEAGAHLFDAGGAVPVDRVQVALPQANSVVRATLFSGPRADGPWTRHHAGLLYRIEPAATAVPSSPPRPLQNEPIDVRVTRHRFFKLVVSPEGGGLGGGAPELLVSWHPEQLLFVQRGPSPFALGYGRADTEHSRFSAAELLRTVGAPAGGPPRETASLGAPHPVGDPSVLEPRPVPRPPPPYGLWAFLVAAVAVVLGLCVRLLRQMRADGDAAP